jgi:hypothetical protein
MGVVLEAQESNAAVRQLETFEQKYRYMVEGISEGALADGKER